MAEDRLDGRDVSWRQLLPWTELFRGFQVALDLNKLLLAALGIVGMWVGWWLLSAIFGAGYDPKPPQWPGTYGQLALSEGEKWAVFKRDRERWNVMHETAGAGAADQKYEAEDLAESPAEYAAVTNALKGVNADDPAALDLALAKLVKQPGDSDPNRVLEPAKARLYERLLGRVKPFGRLARSPWTEDRGPNPYLLATGQTARTEGAPWEAGRFWAWLAEEQLPVLLEPLFKLVYPIVYFFSPRAHGFGPRLYFLLMFLWTVLVWSVFGGAITRIASVQVARGEKVGMTEALRFALRRFVSYLTAPLFPLAFVFALFLFGVVFGLFHMIPGFGDIFVDGLLWPVMLVIGLLMAVALVGLAFAWPLMAPTVSAEGTDSWEAVSRSYSYLIQRPWHYLWYGLVALAYGAAVVFFVGFMSSFAVYLSKWSVAQIQPASRDPSYLFVYAPPSFGWQALLLQGAKDPNGQDVVQFGRVERGPYENYVGELRAWNRIGAWLVAFWLGLFFLFVVGFGYSYFWSAATIIYLLMRRDVDAAELDEVYLEEEDQDAYGGPLTPPAPAGEPAKPGAQPLTMVEPPALRTPAAPAPEAPPVAPSAATEAPAPAALSPVPAESAPAPAASPAPPPDGPSNPEEHPPPAPG
jgi:hypothetical protein